MRLFIVMTTILLAAMLVSGHPGRTNEEGCHYCRTNCEQYGLQQDEYHCHESTTTIENSVESSSTSVKTTSTTSSKKTTSTKESSSSVISSSSSIETTVEVLKLENGIEKDIYEENQVQSLIYESDDYKARRNALYFFSFILILVLAKFVVKK